VLDQGDQDLLDRVPLTGVTEQGRDPRVPTLLCDARQRDSVKQALITLVEHVLVTRALEEEAEAQEQAEPGPGSGPDTLAGPGFL